MHTNEYLALPVQAYALDNDLKDPLVSPLSGNFAIPPVFLQVGENEILYSDKRSCSTKVMQAQNPCG